MIFRGIHRSDRPHCDPGGVLYFNFNRLKTKHLVFGVKIISSIFTPSDFNVLRHQWMTSAKLVTIFYSTKYQCVKKSFTNLFYDPTAYISGIYENQPLLYFGRIFGYLPKYSYLCTRNYNSHDRYTNRNIDVCRKPGFISDR